MLVIQVCKLKYVDFDRGWGAGGGGGGGTISTINTCLFEWSFIARSTLIRSCRTLTVRRHAQSFKAVNQYLCIYFRQYMTTGPLDSAEGACVRARVWLCVWCVFMYVCVGGGAWGRGGGG